MRKWIVTLGGAGLSPVGPGTAGSLVTSLVLLAIYEVAHPSWLVWQIILVAGVVFFSVLCVALGPWSCDHFGKKDPGSMVLDEAAGICLTMLLLPMGAGWRGAWAIAAGFLAFRIFDITKPPPARQLERLPGGWGILLDDLAAGVYGNIVCQIVLRLAM